LDFSHIGAKLKIDSENETGDSRKCDIIGTQAQIECAKQLIDEKIAEDKEFRSRRKSTQEGNYLSSSSTRHLQTMDPSVPYCIILFCLILGDFREKVLNLLTFFL
jgi:hypothetical protein